jgi:hypothetical protein
VTLAGVTQIDGRGIEVLFGARERASDSGQELEFRSPSSEVARTLEDRPDGAALTASRASSAMVGARLGLARVPPGDRGCGSGRTGVEGDSRREQRATSGDAVARRPCVAIRHLLAVAHVRRDVMDPAGRPGGGAEPVDAALT